MNELARASFLREIGAVVIMLSLFVPVFIFTVVGVDMDPLVDKIEEVVVYRGVEE